MSRSKFRPDRLGQLLKVSGFERVFDAFGAFAWARWSADSKIVHQITVRTVGRTHDAFVAHAGIGICRYLPVGPELPLLQEVATVEQRGWAIIRSDIDARSWEQGVATIAPKKADEIAASDGESLLVQTQVSRRAAAMYVAELSDVADVSKALVDLVRDTSDTIVAAARRLAARPPVLLAFGLEPVYELACLVILRKDEGYVDADPLRDYDLNLRIQIVADNIIHSSGFGLDFAK